MSKSVRRHLSFANVMSCVAVFIALGGGAYALSIPTNSVGTKQLKNAAVTGAKVKDGSLLGRDFAAAELAKLRGAAGAPARSP